MVNGGVPKRPEFEITVSADEGVRVVAVSGELDIHTMVEFGAALTTRAEVGATTVVDLRGLTFIDSSGVSGLLGAARRAQEAGRRLVCVPGPASIQRIFQLTGVDTVLEWVDGPDDLG